MNGADGGGGENDTYASGILTGVISLQVASTAAVGDERVELGETFAFRDLTAGLPGTRLHAAVLGFDRFSKDSVLGDATLSLDDNHLLSTLVDRHGILETFELNLQARTAASQSPLNKVNDVF